MGAESLIKQNLVFYQGWNLIMRERLLFNRVVKHFYFLHQNKMFFA